MLSNILLITACVVLNSSVTHEAPEIYLPIPNPPLDLPAYPYQEDLISSIRYLKDEPKIKDEKVRGLMNILKIILEKQLDDSNYEVNKECAALSTDILDDQIKELNSFRQKKESAKLSTNNVNSSHLIQKPIDHNIFDKCVSPEINEAKEQTPANVPVFRIQGLSNTPRHNIDPHVFKLNGEYISSQNIRHNEENFNSKLISSYVGNKAIYSNNPEKSLKQNVPMLSIPCHKASDILEETPRFILPKDAYCEHSNTRPNINIVKEDLKPVSIHEEPVVTNSIICTESEETVAMLFKPKTISLKQVYGNLLKKITVNVLVPYHVSKIAL